MKMIVFLLCAIPLILAQDGTLQGAFKLKDSTFDSITSHYDYLLVHFMIPGCDPCHAFQPAFNAAATKMNQNATSPYIGMATIDCSTETITCKQQQITTYPIVKLFLRGDAFIYGGGSEAAEIIEWMTQKINGGSVEIFDDYNLAKHLGSNPVVLINFKQSNIEIYQSVAKQFPTILFMHTAEPNLKKQYAPEHDIVLFAHHLSEPLKFPSHLDISEAALTIFLESNRYARIMNFTIDSANLIFGGMKTALFLFYIEDVKQSIMMEAKAEFKKVADHFDQDTLPMVLVDLNNPASIRLANLLSLSKDELPCIKIIKPDGESPDDLKKYTYNENNIKAPKIVNFVTKFFDGKILPNYKSQEIPSPDTEQGIKILVASTYEQVVNDVTRDILVLYYTPSCGHCKAIIPTLERIALSLKTNSQGIKNNQLVISKIDVSQNDVPGLKITHYPTIYLYPTEQKEQPILYVGDRTQEGLVRWIKDNGSFHKPKTTDL